MKQGKFIWILSLLSVLGTVAIYSRLPDQIPLHWGVGGDVDRYGSRVFAFFTAILPIIMYGLFLIIPKIDPRNDSYIKHAKAYNAIVFVVVLFIVGIHWATMAFALGFQVNVVFIVKFSLGIIFIVIGNYLPVVKPNYTLGIRTPWTLADEKVWEKTHRVGGYGFVITGFVWAAFAFVNEAWTFYALMAILLIFVIGIVIYSYILFKRGHK